MEPRTKSLILGGAVALGCALCGWYLYRKSQVVKESKPTSKKPKPISKTLMIQILKEQERGYYPFMKITAQIFNEAAEAFGLTIEHMSFAELANLKKEVFTYYPLLEEMFHANAKNIIEKYGLNEEDYHEALLVTFKNDQDVQRLLLQIQDGVTKACTGIEPNPATHIPAILTKEKALQVVAKLIKLENSKVIKCFEIIDDQNQSMAFWSDEENVGKLRTNARIAVQLDNERKKILAEEGLDDFEEAAERILDTTLYIYRKADPEFERKLFDLHSEGVHYAKEIQRKLMERAKREEGTRLSSK